jgi:YD repeat-containing protein
MKNNISFILLPLFTIFIKAQNNSLPEPSTSSIANYVNAGVSPSTGVPSVNLPVYQLETSDKNRTVSVGLSYHPYNAKPDVPASEVGLGWSLFKGGTISRKAIEEVDDTLNWTDTTEKYADVFYYSIPGYSGKFSIYKDPLSNALVLNNITGEKLKFEYTRDLSTTRLVIVSFKITDDKGYQYYFNDYNLGLTKKGAQNINYKTSFLLSRITDAGNNELAAYTYDKKTKYVGTSATIKYQYSKSKEIITAKGKIMFTYDIDTDYFNTENPDNDAYSVKYIKLYDKAGHFISGYEPEYGLMQFVSNSSALIYKRTLSGLKKTDKLLGISEQTNFEYDTTGSDTDYGDYTTSFCNIGSNGSNPQKSTIGLLKKIIFPTKGYVVYNFEANELYADKSQVDYSNMDHIEDPSIQYWGETVIPYHTDNTRTYTFQVNGNQTGTLYPVVVVNEQLNDGFPVYPFDPNDPHNMVLTYTVKDSNGTLVNKQTGCTSDYYKLQAGTYTLNINNAYGYGNFRVYQIKSKPKPYRNYIADGTGARIKMIRSYDSDGSLIKTKKYEYNSFTNPLDATGHAFYGDPLDPMDFTEYFILYKNVKETEISGNDTNGSIRYSFKTPDDYKDVNSKFLYYNLTSGGVMAKKEVYDHLNHLQESYDYEYTFQDIPNSLGYTVYDTTTKPAWLQYSKETAKTYLGQSADQTVSETTFSPDNFQESLSKTTAQDGSVTETATKYAQDVNNTRFITANMISVPLQLETKTDGTVMTKVTTKYDNTGHFYPTSVESTDLNQTAETQITFDVYDNKGNLVQTTDKAGNSVTTIWGYDQTLPIAQITGAKYSDISSLPVITAAISASNADADNPANEGGLLTALDNLRTASQLQGYSITTYTYDPLVGITHSISPNGIKATYEYDASGRLLRVKNSEGQILKENQYNYKH